MLTEIILTLAALLLGVYCLIRSVRTRGEIFFPLPKGLPALLKSRAVWLVVTAALPVTAAVSLAEMAAESLNASARSSFWNPGPPGRSWRRTSWSSGRSSGRTTAL